MRLVSKIFLLFLVYFITARIGLSLGAVNDFATPVWPPTGISLAALLLFGRKLWPAIFLGAFFVNLVTGASAFVSFGIATGNTLEAVCGAYLLNYFGFRNSFERLKDALILVLAAAIFSTLVSSMIGTISLLLGGLINLGDFYETWFAWWIGDMLGNLVVAPFLLVWSTKMKLTSSLTDRLGLSLVFLILILTISIAFGSFLGVSTTSLPIIYIVVPPLIWIAVRFNPKASISAIFLLSVLAIWGTVLGYGIFANPNLSHSLLILQGFLGVHATTFLILASVIADRKELERKKDEFIGVASHELKTPITTLRAYVQLLEKAPNTRAISTYLPRISREVDRIIDLINNLLDFNKVSSNKIDLNKETILINEIIDSIINDIQVSFPERKILYKNGQVKEVKVVVDKYRIEQVLINLLQNAIKFSPNSKKVEVILRKNKKYIQVSVKDFGVGIDPKHHKEIFTKFFQTKKKSNEVYSGLGLGLYISSEIIKRHGGEIWVESKEGKGSTFSFTLPLEKSLAI